MSDSPHKDQLAAIRNQVAFLESHRERARQVLESLESTLVVDGVRSYTDMMLGDGPEVLWWRHLPKRPEWAFYVETKHKDGQPQYAPIRACTLSVQDRVFAAMGKMLNAIGAAVQADAMRAADASEHIQAAVAGTLGDVDATAEAIRENDANEPMNDPDQFKARQAEIIDKIKADFAKDVTEHKDSAF